MIFIVLVSIMSGACSVMSTQVREASDPQLSYQELLHDTAEHIGKTVILGGYVIEVKNSKRGTLITALQAPLGFRDEPKSKDLSKGRLLVSIDYFIDPEVYQKERKFTVGGVITGGSSLESEESSYPFVNIEAIELYLWSVVKPSSYYHDYYYDCWRYGYSPYRPWPCW